MKTNVSPAGENEVELSVDVPAEAVKKAYNRTLAQVRSRLQLPGFRKGKVPVELVIRQVGEEYLRHETLEAAMPRWGDEALKESGLWDDAVGTIDLKAGPLDETADYSFSLKVQMMPVPALGEYKGLEVPRREVAVTDEQVDSQLAQLRERGARLQPVEGRAVQSGDFVLMDFEGMRDGEPIEGAQGADQVVEIGRGNLIPGFEESVIGMQHGEDTTFAVTFPDDYHAGHLAGQDATFKVQVKEIKEKVVPDLDDAFAADISEFETLEELRADVRKRLVAAAEVSVAREYHAAAVEKAVENATLRVPSTMIDREAHRLYHQLEQNVASQGMSMESYLGLIEKSPQAMEEELRPQAEFVIKRQLVLEAIAEAEGLEVTDDDIAAVVRRDAEMLGRDHLELLADLRKSGRQEVIRSEMLLAKAADMVAESAVAVAMTEAAEAAAEAVAEAAESDDAADTSDGADEVSDGAAAEPARD